MLLGDSMFYDAADKGFTEKWQQAVKGKIFSSCVADGKYAVVAANPEDKTGIFESGSSGIWIYNSSGEEFQNTISKEKSEIWLLMRI